MMVYMSKHKCVSMLILIVLTYLVQFVWFPRCFPKYYPRSNEAWALFFVPLIVLAVIGSVVVRANVKTWLIADVLYWIMLLIYHGKGHYGIGLRGITLDGLQPKYSWELAMITISIIVVLLVGFQLLIGKLCSIIFKR